jgi:hypothetical protein
VKTLLSLILLLVFKLASAQAWDKFSYFTTTDKNFYDVDDQSMLVRNDILSGWIRIRDKNDANTFIDKLNIHCQTFQYAISTRRSVDKDGKLIKILFDNEISTLKWNDTAETSVGRKLAIKYCKNSSNNTAIKSNNSEWLSLGKSDTSDFTYYIDPLKNRKINDELYYQAKIEYYAEKKLPGSNKEYSVIIQDTVINCREISVAILKTEYLNKSSFSVDNSVISKEFAKFNIVTSTSFAGRVAEKYCDSQLSNKGSVPSEKETVNNQAVKDALLSEISEKCTKLGYKKGSSPHDRCIKQLLDY